MRFPVTIRHRASKAKIYRPAGKFAYYRVAYTVAGKRRMQTFAVYSDAKAAAERIVREAASGSQAAALSASQSRDALAALERLESFRQSTGRAISLLAAASELVESLGKLHGRSLDEAVTGYPVHPNKPLLQLTPGDVVRLRLNVRDFVSGYGRSHGLKKHHPDGFIKPHPAAQANGWRCRAKSPLPMPPPALRRKKFPDAIDNAAGKREI